VLILGINTWQPKDSRMNRSEGETYETPDVTSQTKFSAFHPHTVM